MSDISRDKLLHLLSGMRIAFKAQTATAETATDQMVATASDAVCASLQAAVKVGALDADPHPEPPC